MNSSTQRKNLFKTKILSLAFCFRVFTFTYSFCFSFTKNNKDCSENYNFILFEKKKLCEARRYPARNFACGKSSPNVILVILMNCLKISSRLIKRGTNNILENVYIQLFYVTTLMRYRKKALRIKTSYDIYDMQKFDFRGNS